VTRLFHAFAALGGLALACGWLFAPDRTWPALLVVSLYLIGLGLAGAFLVALEYVTGATWSIALRRVPEAMTAGLPAGAIGLALVLVFGSSIYPWATDPAALHGLKATWLARPFVLARAAVYLGVWLVLARALVRTSRRQDVDGAVVHTLRNRRLSAIFIVVFAVTLWLASMDWVMALDAHWYSTMFGLYNFAGLFLAGLAATALLTVLLERAGLLREAILPSHRHDLGKLLFAFSTFWMYIWFSQYMLIWYANLPEETGYFVTRLQPAWRPYVLLSLALNWVVPFVVLLPQAAKRSATVLARVSIAILVGRLADLYVMVGASAGHGATPSFGLLEIGLALGALGVFGALFLRAFAAAPPVPARDPFLAGTPHPVG
jgi:hypothetical protein